jgi:hypothetical protein
MLFFILAFFGTCALIVFFCIGVIILGEYLVSKYENSKFAKWWRKNVVSPMPEDYES